MQYSEDSSLLTICIPTYNRSRFLNHGVRKLGPYAQQYGVSIIILDNASPDDTEIIGKRLADDFPNIKYYRNETNIGPDRNFEKVLKLSETRYAWLMSDDDMIAYDKIPLILDALAKYNLDMMILNSPGRVQDVASKLYTNHDELLSEIGWHMQFISCLIFSKDIIWKANFRKYYNTNLIQFGVIFDTLAKKNNIQVYFLADNLVFMGFDDFITSRNDGDGWISHALDIFVNKWSKIILSLPASYNETAKKKAIMDHGLKSGLFTFKSIIWLSVYGYISPKKLIEVKRYYHYAISYPYFMIKAITYIPSNKITVTLYLALRKLYRCLCKRG